MYVVTVSVGQITHHFSRNDILTLFPRVKPDDYQQIEPYKVGKCFLFVIFSLTPLTGTLPLAWLLDAGFPKDACCC